MGKLTPSQHIARLCPSVTSDEAIAIYINRYHGTAIQIRQVREIRRANG